MYLNPVALDSYLHSPKCIVTPQRTVGTRNIISYTAQVLLLCVKRCLPPLHNYLEIDGIFPQIRKKSIGFWMVFLLLIFILTLGCFSLSIRLFRYQIASVSCCVCVCVFLVYIFVVVFSFAFLCVCVRSWRAFVFLKYPNVNSVSSLGEPFRFLEQMLQYICL